MSEAAFFPTRHAWASVLSFHSFKKRFHAGLLNLETTEFWRKISTKLVQFTPQKGTFFKLEIYIYKKTTTDMYFNEGFVSVKPLKLKNFTHFGHRVWRTDMDLGVL